MKQKRAIVFESLGPDLTPTEVTRKYRISTGQLYTWRQQLLSLPGSVVSQAALSTCRSEVTMARD